MDIDPRDISVAHRHGRVNEASNSNKRPIIIKFCRRDLVSEIFKACRRHKPKFYVNEQLTPLSSKIMHRLRQLKKKKPGKVKGCVSQNGEPRVFLATSNGNPNKRISIVTREQLEVFVRDHLQTTLPELSLTW